MDSTQNLNLEFLKKSAKSILKNLRSGDPIACERYRRLVNSHGRDVKLADVQYFLAKEHGYSSWAKLKADNGSDLLKRALQDLNDCKAIVLFDDESRENEGDFVIAAEKVTAEHVNFITQYGRGTVCVSLSQQIAKQLQLSFTNDLQPIDAPNFSTPLDHIDTKTGISTKERANTIRQIATQSARAEDFRRPGHIATLIEHEQGIDARQGHTEGSLHLMRLAGLRPAALICEILNEDGSMARKYDLQDIAKKHGLTYLGMSEFVRS